MDNAKRFREMTVLITGASSGIGAVAAVSFTDQGAHVLVQ